MKKYFGLVVTALFLTTVVSLAGPEKEAIMAKEKAAWQAFKDKKADDFKKVVSADMVAVYAEGMYDMAKEVADMQKWDMRSFEITNFKVNAIGSDVVVTTYNVAIQGGVEGKDASGTYNAASVWKMDKSGAWTAIFHTNMKEAPATK